MIKSTERDFKINEIKIYIYRQRQRRRVRNICTRIRNEKKKTMLRLFTLNKYFLALSENSSQNFFPFEFYDEKFLLFPLSFSLFLLLLLFVA